MVPEKSQIRGAGVLICILFGMKGIASPIEFSSPSSYPNTDFGFSLSSTFDIDGDGAGDVLIGDRENAVAHLYSVGKREFLRTFSSPNPTGNGQFSFSLDAAGTVGWWAKKSDPRSPRSSPVTRRKSVERFGFTGAAARARAVSRIGSH